MVTKLLDEEAIFKVAAGIPSEETRHDYLQQVCGGDESLLHRLLTLLQAHDKSPRFMESSPVAVERTFIAPPEFEAPGTMIGSYKIREQLGEGGMGVVYVADQTEPVRRRVALKVIKPGMDSKEIIGRFQAERQTLAIMSHPNIAKVLDGGTTGNGRPYFVMELVKGIPITEFCDQQKLSIRERLELFTTVCQAVQHAHMKGIIHRDLKPSNVMVELHDVVAVPKVIDFGIAKATNQQMTQQTVYTQFSQLVGTPLYMSPEQAQVSGIDIDTRSDVYSLGVMLYEILTGVTPFDKSTLSSVGVDEMRRIIREDEPLRPSNKVSTLDHQQISTISESRQTIPNEMSLSMQRELDWIVMKALEKDRTRRYESANALAADIQRYLDDEPVQACPPTVKYRLTKYAKRHKGLLTTATVMAVTLLVATGVSVSYAVQADQERQQADIARDDADEQKDDAIAAKKQAEKNLVAALDAVDKLLEHASSPALREIPQAQPIRQKILEDVLAFYEQFKITTGDSETLRFRAALTWASLGDFGADVGQLDLARKGHDESLKLLDGLLKQSPSRWEYQEQFMQRSLAYGWFHHHLSERQQAQKYFERVRSQADELLLNADANQPDGIRRQLIQKQVQARLGLADNAQGSGDSTAFREFVLDAHRLIDGSIDLISRHSATALLKSMAEIHSTSDPDLADQYFRDAIQISRDSLQENSTRFRNSWHAGLLRKAVQFFQHRDDQFAEELARESVIISERLETDFPAIPDYDNWREDSLDLLLDLLKSTGQVEEANRLLLESIATNPSTAKDYAQRAKIYRQLGDFDKALADYERAIEIDPNDTRIQSTHAEAVRSHFSPEQAISALSHSIEKHPTSSSYFRHRGEVYRDRDEFELALADLNRAIELTDRQDRKAFEARAKLFDKTGEYAKAVDDWSRIMELSKSWHYYKRRAVSLFRLGQYDKALADLNTSLDLEPGDVSAVWWIPLSEVASCPDENFKEGMKALANRAVELNNQSSDSLTVRASFLLAFGELEQARKDLDAVAAAEDAGYYPLYQAALLSVATDDSDRYTELCQQMLTRFTDSDISRETHFTAWACALAPAAIEDYAPAIKLARHAVAQEPENQQYINGLGAILMRAGEYVDAKENLEQALAAAGSANTSTSYIHYFLAMTEQHLGNADAAQTLLKEANTSSEKELADSPPWNRKLTLELLRKEAEALIKTTDVDDDNN